MRFPRFFKRNKAASVAPAVAQVFPDAAPAAQEPGHLSSASATEASVETVQSAELVDPHSDDASPVAAPLQPEAQSARRKWFGRRAAKVAAEPALEGQVVDAAELAAAEPKKSRFRVKKADKPAFSAVPIRVIIGYLPEVTEKDALDYAMGIADKHFEQLGLAYYDAFQYDGGYVFEAHEGGHGKAYSPQILEYFISQGPFRSSETHSVVIRTATRKVEVQRARQGLTAIVLPESSDLAPTAWLTPGSPMTPALNKRTGLLATGAALFVTGFMALMVAAFVARYQPYEAAPRMTPEVLSMQDLPMGQWPVLQSVPAGSYVKALRFRNGRWEPPEVTTPGEAASSESTALATALVNEGQMIQGALVLNKAEGKPQPTMVQGLVDAKYLAAGALSKISPSTPLTGPYLVTTALNQAACEEVEARAGRDKQLEKAAQPGAAGALYGCMLVGSSGAEVPTYYYKL